MNAEARERTIRDGPFCWQSKKVLDLLHGAFTETNNLPAGYGVYIALSVLASDLQAETFTVRKALIAFKAGVSIRTASDILKRLEMLALVSIDRHITAGTTPDGASTYTLLPVGNGCLPVGNGRLMSSIADKVEESENKDTEQKKEQSPQKAFSAFWQVYPKKIGKLPAEKAWRRQGCTALLNQILVAVRQQIDSPDWRKDGGQFVPHPTTWLSQHRWEDEPSSNGAASRMPFIP